VIEFWCDLNGPRMLICAEDQALLDPLMPIWSRLATKPGPSADFTVTIDRGAIPRAPESTPIRFEGKSVDGLPCIVHQSGVDEYFRVDGKLGIHLSTFGCRIIVAPGAERLLASSLGFNAIAAGLEVGGQYCLHAAALALNNRDSAIVIFGPSGFGKTTTALSLLPAGFRLLADDTVIIQKDEGGAHRVWGLPRPLKVHKRSARMMAWLAPHLTGRWDAEGEQLVLLESLQSSGTLVPPRPYPISAIVALGERTGGAHQMRAIGKADMLVRIASDNVARNPYSGSMVDQTLMRRITELVTAAPAYEFRAGRDLDDLPRALLEELAVQDRRVPAEESIASQ
jgi:hypothetical protein